MAQAPKPYDFTPLLVNPSKYKGKFPIMIRSSWERKFADICDLSPLVLQWAVEPVSIPYKDPVTGNQKVYIPDFLVAYRKSARGSVGRVVKCLIEIKPSHETLITEARNPRDAERLIRNQAKWAMAKWWCQRRGINFQILTEKQLFGNVKSPTKTKTAAQSKRFAMSTHTSKQVRRQKASLLKRRTYGRWKKKR